MSTPGRRKSGLPANARRSSVLMQIDQVVQLQVEEAEQAHVQSQSGSSRSLLPGGGHAGSSAGSILGRGGAAVGLGASAPAGGASSPRFSTNGPREAGPNHTARQRQRYRHFNHQLSKVNLFTLSFQDPKLEAAYRRYIVSKSAKRTRWACAAFLTCVVILGTFEYLFGYSGDATNYSNGHGFDSGGYFDFGDDAFSVDTVNHIGAIRGVTCAVPLAFLLFVSPSWKPRTLELIIGSTFAAHGVLLVAAVCLGSARGLPFFFPFAWWSSSYDMVHCAVTQLSGVRFPVAATVALIHPFILCFGFLAKSYHESLHDGHAVPPLGANSDQLLLSCACIVGCLLVAYRREHIERKEFVSLLNVTADKRMRQDLINDMLPEKIRNLLQYGKEGVEADDTQQGDSDQAESHSSAAAGATASQRNSFIGTINTGNASDSTHGTSSAAGIAKALTRRLSSSVHGGNAYNGGGGGGSGLFTDGRSSVGGQQQAASGGAQVLAPSSRHQSSNVLTQQHAHHHGSQNSSMIRMNSFDDLQEAVKRLDLGHSTETQAGQTAGTSPNVVGGGDGTNARDADAAGPDRRSSAAASERRMSGSIASEIMSATANLFINSRRLSRVAAGDADSRRRKSSVEADPTTGNGGRLASIGEAAGSADSGGSSSASASGSPTATADDQQHQNHHHQQGQRLGFSSTLRNDSVPSTPWRQQPDAAADSGSSTAGTSAPPSIANLGGAAATIALVSPLANVALPRQASDAGSFSSHARTPGVVASPLLTNLSQAGSVLSSFDGAGQQHQLQLQQDGKPMKRTRTIRFAKRVGTGIESPHPNIGTGNHPGSPVVDGVRRQSSSHADEIAVGGRPAQSHREFSASNAPAQGSPVSDKAHAGGRRNVGSAGPSIATGDAEPSRPPHTAKLTRMQSISHRIAQGQQLAQSPTKGTNRSSSVPRGLGAEPSPTKAGSRDGTALGEKKGRSQSVFARSLSVRVGLVGSNANNGGAADGAASSTSPLFGFLSAIGRVLSPRGSQASMSSPESAVSPSSQASAAAAAADAVRRGSLTAPAAHAGETLRVRPGALSIRNLDTLQPQHRRRSSDYSDGIGSQPAQPDAALHSSVSVSGHTSPSKSSHTPNAAAGGGRGRAPARRRSSLAAKFQATTGVDLESGGLIHGDSFGSSLLEFNGPKSMLQSAAEAGDAALVPTDAGTSVAAAVGSSLARALTASNLLSGTTRAPGHRRRSSVNGKGDDTSATTLSSPIAPDIVVTPVAGPVLTRSSSFEVASGATRGSGAGVGLYAPKQAVLAVTGTATPTASSTSLATVVAPRRSSITRAGPTSPGYVPPSTAAARLIPAEVPAAAAADAVGRRRDDDAASGFPPSVGHDSQQNEVVLPFNEESDDIMAMGDAAAAMFRHPSGKRLVSSADLPSAAHVPDWGVAPISKSSRHVPEANSSAAGMYVVDIEGGHPALSRQRSHDMQHTHSHNKSLQRVGSKVQHWNALRGSLYGESEMFDHIKNQHAPNSNKDSAGATDLAIRISDAPDDPALLHSARQQGSFQSRDPDSSRRAISSQFDNRPDQPGMASIAATARNVRAFLGRFVSLDSVRANDQVNAGRLLVDQKKPHHHNHHHAPYPGSAAAGHPSVRATIAGAPQGSVRNTSLRKLIASDSALYGADDHGNTPSSAAAAAALLAPSLRSLAANSGSRPASGAKAGTVTLERTRSERAAAEHHLRVIDDGDGRLSLDSHHGRIANGSARVPGGSASQRSIPASGGRSPGTTPRVQAVQPVHDATPHQEAPLADDAVGLSSQAQLHTGVLGDGDVQHDDGTQVGDGGAGHIEDEDDDGEMDEAIGHNFESVTVMFVYISNLSKLAARAQPLELITFLNDLYTKFDAIVEATGVYKVMAIANMYLCVAGALDENADHAATMATTALEIMKFVKGRRAELQLAGQAVRIQIGLHSGEAAGGVIGTKTFNWHVFGDTVNTASRMCSNNDLGKIQVSAVTAEALRQREMERGCSVSSCELVPATSPTSISAQAALLVSDSSTGTAAASRFILRQRVPAVSFKGKGVLTTFWLSDSALDVFDQAEAMVERHEREQRLRIKLLQLQNAERTTSKLNEATRDWIYEGSHPTTADDGPDGSSRKAGFMARIRNMYTAINQSVLSTHMIAPYRAGEHSSSASIRHQMTPEGVDGLDHLSGAGHAHHQHGRPHQPHHHHHGHQLMHGQASVDGSSAHHYQHQHLGRKTASHSPKDRIEDGKHSPGLRSSLRFLSHLVTGGTPKVHVSSVKDIKHQLPARASTQRVLPMDSSGAVPLLPVHALSSTPRRSSDPTSSARSVGSFASSISGTGRTTANGIHVTSVSGIRSGSATGAIHVPLQSNISVASVNHIATPNDAKVHPITPAELAHLDSGPNLLPHHLHANRAHHEHLGHGQMHRASPRAASLQPPMLAVIRTEASVAGDGPMAATAHPVVAPVPVLHHQPADGTTSATESPVAATRPSAGLTIAKPPQQEPTQTTSTVGVAETHSWNSTPAPAPAASAHPAPGLPSVVTDASHDVAASTPRLNRPVSLSADQTPVAAASSAALVAVHANVHPPEPALNQKHAHAHAAPAPRFNSTFTVGGLNIQHIPGDGSFIAMEGLGQLPALQPSPSTAAGAEALALALTQQPPGALTAPDGSPLALMVAPQGVGQPGPLGNGRRGSGFEWAHSLDRERMVNVRVEPMQLLTLRFTDVQMEHKFQRWSQAELRIQVQRALFLATMVAIAALVKSALFDVNRFGEDAIRVTMLSRYALVGITAVAFLVAMSPLGRSASLHWPPLHEHLSCLVAIAFCGAMNSELFPPVVVSNGREPASGLANLNFVLLLVFSFLELSAYVLSMVNMVCFTIYVALLCIADSLDVTALNDKGAHIFLCAVAAMFSCATAYVREKSRRNRFVVQEQAMRQRDKCERLLLNMLPSHEHAERLMRGENVVEVLEDVTMLYSDIKGFTEMSSKLSPEDLIKFLDRLYTAFDKHLDVFGLYKIETIGDAFIVVGGMTSAGLTATNGADGASPVAAASDADKGASSGLGADGDVSDDAYRTGRTRRRSSLAGFMSFKETLFSRRNIDVDKMDVVSTSHPLKLTKGSSHHSHGSSGHHQNSREHHTPIVVGGTNSRANTLGTKDANGTIGSYADVLKRTASKAAMVVHGASFRGLFSMGSRKNISTACIAPAPVMLGDMPKGPNDNSQESGRSLATTAGLGAPGDSPHASDPPASCPRVIPRARRASVTIAAAGHFLAGLQQQSEKNVHSTAGAASSAVENGGGKQQHDHSSARVAPISTSSVTASASRSNALTGATSRISGTSTLDPMSTGRGSTNAAGTGFTVSDSLDAGAGTSDRRSFDPAASPSALQGRPELQVAAHEEEHHKHDLRSRKPPELLRKSQGPPTQMSHAGAIAAFAMDMLAEVQRVREETGTNVDLRIGIHTGKAVGGIIGKSRPRYFIWGEDTLIANQMESSGIAGCIQVSEAAAVRLVEEGFEVEPHQVVESGADDHKCGHDDEDDIDGGDSTPKEPQTINTYLLKRYTAPDGIVYDI